MFTSVVVPTWNRSAYLPALLRSLATQDLPRDEWEVVVVDDGSTDDTARVMARLQLELGEKITIRYEPMPHAGLNAGRNHGINKSTGDLICFLDDDVRAPSSWLSAMVSGVQANPGAAAYGGPIDLVVSGRTPRSCGREDLGETLQDFGAQVCEPPTLFGANLTIPMSAIHQHGMFDVDIVCGAGDETEWMNRARSGGGRLCYLPGPRIEHLRHPDDVRLRRLLARRFSRGRGQIDSAAGHDMSYALGSELMQVLRSLAHSVRYRCALGLLAVAMSSGRVWGLVRRRRFRVP